MTDSLRDLLTSVKPRVRVKTGRRWLGVGVPDDAVPGDLVLGNRGAGAVVRSTCNSAGLALEYCGNFGAGGPTTWDQGKVYDKR